LDSEVEESEGIEGGNKEEQMKEKSAGPSHLNGGGEVNRVKIRTNLEFLLSQNDILPLIRKINKEKAQKGGVVCLGSIIKTNEKKARVFLKFLENKSKYFFKCKTNE
jgi:hypothetical protein